MRNSGGSEKEGDLRARRVGRQAEGRAVYGNQRRASTLGSSEMSVICTVNVVVQYLRRPPEMASWGRLTRLGVSPFPLKPLLSEIGDLGEWVQVSTEVGYRPKPTNFRPIYFLQEFDMWIETSHLLDGTHLRPHCIPSWMQGPSTHWKERNGHGLDCSIPFSSMYWMQAYHGLNVSTVQYHKWFYCGHCSNPAVCTAATGALFLGQVTSHRVPVSELE